MMNDVFVVLNEGSVVYATHDYDEADSYAEDRMDESIKYTADEYDYDLEDPGEFDKAVVQNGMDGGIFEVVRIPKEKLTIDNIYQLPDGGEIDINEVLDLIDDEDNEIYENFDE